MITLYDLSRQEEWDRIVKSFSDYEVFYLSGYSRAFREENARNGDPLLLYYENGPDRAVSVILRRDIALDENLKGKIPEGRYFDLITPYGYGGFFGNVSDWDHLNEEYAAYCLENHFICEFVRFELFSDYYAHYAGEITTRTHNVVRSLDLPLEEIWMDFKAKVRKNVKRANSHNLSIIIEPTGEYLKDFLRIYYSTMDRTDAENEFYFSEHFFRDLNEMRDNVMYFHAVHEGRIISTELVIYGADNAYSYLGGTEREYFDLRPNDFLKYEIIRWAVEKGLKNFVLGGGYGTDDGIFQYKQALAPNGIVEYYIGRRIFDREMYDQLVSLRGDAELNEQFFPLYRAAEIRKETQQGVQDQEEDVTQ